MFAQEDRSDPHIPLVCCIGIEDPNWYKQLLAKTPGIDILIRAAPEHLIKPTYLNSLGFPWYARLFVYMGVHPLNTKEGFRRIQVVWDTAELLGITRFTGAFFKLYSCRERDKWVERIAALTAFRYAFGETPVRIILVNFEAYKPLSFRQLFQHVEISDPDYKDPWVCYRATVQVCNHPTSTRLQ